MQELSAGEIDAVGGGVPLIAVYVFYAAGGTAGVAAGWQFVRALLCDR